jgi:hypothetical protein
MDGYTYEQPAGGWHMCDRCGVRVSDEVKHDAFHKRLGLVLARAWDQGYVTARSEIQKHGIVAPAACNPYREEPDE